MTTILVIDDNADIRENTAEILALAGYRVLTADNGKTGVETAIRERPALIVCDIMMPGLDGYGVLHLVRKNEGTQQVPFIFLTAKTERGDFRRGMEMGADDYITKPFDDIELLNAIEARLRKSSIGQQSYSAEPAGLSSFLNDVKNAGFGNLAGQYEIHSRSAKQVLYAETKTPRYVFYICSGKVKCSRSNEDGKEYITDLMTAGDFAGYAAVIANSNYDDTAIVLEDAEIMQIPRADFLKILYDDPAIAAKFIQLIARNVKEKEARLLSLAYSSLRKRVAHALCDIHGKFDIAGGKPISISREEIAQYVGTATESLIRTLSDFKSEKLIEIKEGKITIPDPGKLKSMRY